MNNPTRITIELKTNGIPNIKALLKALEFKAHDYLMAKGCGVVVRRPARTGKGNKTK